MASKLKLFVVAMVGFVTIGLAGFFMIQPVQAQTGGLDLDGHCRTHHGSGARAVNVDGTAHGWRCESGGVQHTMNMDSACVEQYGSWSTAHYSEYNDQNSWYCEIPQQNQPPVQEPVVQDPPPAQQSGNTVTAVVTVCSSDHHVGTGNAVVLSETDLSVRMRTGPGLDNSEIRQLRSGTRFEIIGGPRCVDGYVWWEIRHNNRTGWVAEGTASERWIARVVTATVTVTRRDTPYAPGRIPGVGRTEEWMGTCTLTGLNSVWYQITSDPLNYLTTFIMPSTNVRYLEDFANWLGSLGNVTQIFSVRPDEITLTFFRLNDRYRVYYEVVGFDEQSVWRTTTQQTYQQWIDANNCMHPGILP